MKSCTRFIAAAAVALWTSVCIFQAQAQEITTFYIPGEPIAISAAGEIVGSYGVGSRQYGFIRQKNGTIVSFAPPDYPCGEWSCRTHLLTYPTGINASGEITGYSILADVPIGPGPIGRLHRGDGFIRHRDGTFTVFHPTGDYVRTTGINPQAQVIGHIHDDLPSPTIALLRHPDGTVETFQDFGRRRHIEFLTISPSGAIGGWSDEIGTFVRKPDGAFIPFSVANSEFSRPIATNPAGTIVGWYRDIDGFVHGFLRQANGVVISFEVPGAVSTQPAAINARGDVVGTYTDSNLVSHGFVRDQTGYITTFDVPNSVSTTATAINASGDITGWYSDGTGAYGFIRSNGGNSRQSH